MSKKLKAYLTKLGIENIDEVITAINAEDDNEEIIDKLLASSQSYAKPFLKSELGAEFANERKTLKGKYFKEAAQKANKEFGSVLTNKEIDDIISDPENEGSTYDAVIKAVKEKVSDKTGKSDSELQKMLDASNNENATLKTTLAEKDEAHKKELTDTIGKIKLDSVLNKKLAEILPKFTSMNPVKAAELIIDKIGKRAFMKLGEGDTISLHDVSDPEKPLKKSETQLQTFEGLIGDLAKDYELPVAASRGGNQRTTTKTDNKADDDKAGPKISPAAQGLMNVLKAASA